MRRLTWSACAAAMVVLVAGCGGPEDATPKSPLNEDQAAERVEKHVSDSAAALSDSPDLKPLSSGTSAACDAEPLVTVSKRYWLEGLSAKENEQNAEALIEYWESNGYTVTDDLRPDKLFVSVRNDKDKFTMSLRSSAQDSLSLGASSPCIHPSGTDE